MASFRAYLPHLMANEGGYCHRPTDPGGETYRGIARTQNPGWPGWATLDALKQQMGLLHPVPQPYWHNLNVALAANTALTNNIEAFYQANYWHPLLLDQVASQSVANQLADHGINAGIRRPAKMLQYLLNNEFGIPLLVDGIVGARTIAALNSVTPGLFYMRFVDMRRAFYSFRAGHALPPDQADWQVFFRTQLNLMPDARAQPNLTAWLSRTGEAFTA